MNKRKEVQIKEFIEMMFRMRKMMFEIDDCDRKSRSTTLLQFSGLVILDQSPGSTVNEIANKFLMSSAAISQYLNRLQKAGLIIKKADSSDKRINRVYLSKKGQLQLKLIQQVVYKKIERLLTSLSSQELTIMINIQRKLFTNLERQYSDENS